MSKQSTLVVDEITLLAADLGPENPLPPLLSAGELHEVEISEGIPEDMQQNIGYGYLPNILPYTMQDGYGREQKPKAFKVAILENDYLKATFLLDYGGRLWSLFHKPSGRDLVTVNPVFQPANLALRNAWFSGGVEWNIGTIGHTPFTCAPMFAAKLETDDGTPLLRLYEWERIRQVKYQLDFFLPADSQMLYVHASIHNQNDSETPMYWWSNIAVPESQDTRVVVPADSCYRFGYQKELKVIPVPEFDGVDRSYSTKSKRAIDYFFHLENEERPWITALDAEGKGLIQVSTQALKGRKLFLWGTGQGGSRWQEWLSEPDYPYLEIQAGLARTQLEHLRMPANTIWDWFEAYGLMDADAEAVHKQTWQDAQGSIEEKLDDLLPRDVLNRLLSESRSWQDNDAGEILHHGSSWGYLEAKRLELDTVFPKSNDPNIQPWLTLLETGSFPQDAFDEHQPAFMIQHEWKLLLEKALEKEENNWAGWLHMGIMQSYAGDVKEACNSWQKSLSYKKTAWALRNLAVFEMQEGKAEKAVELYLEAHSLRPELVPLTIELGEAMLGSGKSGAWLELTQTLSPTQQSHGRIRFLMARAALIEEDLDKVQAFFDDQVEIADIREGATQLTDLWYAFHAIKLGLDSTLSDDLIERLEKEFPIPKHFDFRMFDS